MLNAEAGNGGQAPGSPANLFAKPNDSERSAMNDLPLPGRLFKAALLLAALLHSVVVLGAETALPRPVSLPLPTGDRVVLTVTGEGGGKTYTLAQIEAQGLYELTTSTFWPEDDGTYQGVLLSALLTDAGLVDSAAVRIAALDDYSQVIPREDWRRWPVLLATRREGAPMSIQDKGPLRIIYPRDMDPRLGDPTYRLRWVWLVTTIEQVTP